MKNYFAHCPIQDLWENKKAPPICRSLACIAPLVKTDSGENGGGTDRFEAGELLRGQMVSFMHQRQSPLHQHDVQPSPSIITIIMHTIHLVLTSVPQMNRHQSDFWCLRAFSGAHFGANSGAMACGHHFQRCNHQYCIVWSAICATCIMENGAESDLKVLSSSSPWRCL